MWLENMRNDLTSKSHSYVKLAKTASVHFDDNISEKMLKRQLKDMGIEYKRPVKLPIQSSAAFKNAVDLQSAHSLNELYKAVDELYQILSVQPQPVFQHAKVAQEKWLRMAYKRMYDAEFSKKHQLTFLGEENASSVGS